MCASTGASGGLTLVPDTETAGGARTCGCKLTEILGQTGEMDYHPELVASGGNSDRYQNQQLARGYAGGDEVKEEESEVRTSRS